MSSVTRPRETLAAQAPLPDDARTREVALAAFSGTVGRHRRSNHVSPKPCLRLKLALSILCEHPTRQTGLSTLFTAFVGTALALEPTVEWLVFAGPNQAWELPADPRVTLVRDYPANDDLKRRLVADHFLVPARARRLGAAALLTVGFVPVLRRVGGLPVVMHLFSLQHLATGNRVGVARRLYRGLVVRRGLRGAALVITNSAFAAGQILAVEPGCRSRLLVSPEGLDHGKFHPAAPPGEAERVHAEFGGLPPGGYLLWISNFYPYKQAEKLLAAYARLPAELRARHPLAMVGGGWEGGLDVARAHAAGLGIGGDVRFLGWVGERWLAPLYRQARAHVLASREETWGRCVTEAMACGTPSVVNNIPVMVEVTGGHAARTVDFDQPETVVTALTELLTDDALHTRLRADGLAWVQRFSFARLTAERLAAIKAVLAGQPILPAPPPPFP